VHDAARPYEVEEAEDEVDQVEEFDPEELAAGGQQVRDDNHQNLHGEQHRGTKAEALAHLQCTQCHAVSGHWALNGVGGRALCAPW
jgi:hypothetical protein